MSSVDEYIRKLNEIDELVVFINCNGEFCVMFDDYDIKEAGAIRSAVGVGLTLFKTLQNFVKEISGRTLISTKSHEEVIVLIIEKGE